MGELPQTYTGVGLVDLQVNGYAGFSFNGDASAWRAEDFRRIGRLLDRRGVCAVLPTLITDEPAAMIARARRYGELIGADESLAGRFPALHIEGPFVSAADGPRGAHPKKHCRTPDEMPDFIDRLQEATGDRVGIVTLAPELPGAIDLIGRLAEAGICPAVGHTQAPAETLLAAVAAGAKLSTHLGNASHDVLPRLDNYVQVQLAEDRLAATFIPDGHHMPLTTLKNFIRAKTPSRSVLITDAISAAEMGPGQYALGQLVVQVSADGRCSVPGEQHLAGSILTLDRAIVEVCRRCDVSFDQAWAMASSQPATLVGLPLPPTITVAVEETGFTVQDSRGSAR